MTVKFVQEAAQEFLDVIRYYEEAEPGLGRVFARFTDVFQTLVAIPANRQLMREALISRYFPNSLPNKNNLSFVAP